MVFHLTHSIPEVVALAATVTLSLESGEEAVSSCAEHSSLSLVQRQSIRLNNTKGPPTLRRPLLHPRLVLHSSWMRSTDHPSTTPA